MKLVIEKDHNGIIFIYRETEKQHKVVEKDRLNRYTKLEVNTLDDECNTQYLPNKSYIVVDINK